MNIEYALIAERADFLRDSRLSIFGANTDAFFVSSLPAVIDFCVVARIFSDGDEPLDGHALGIEMTPPKGDRKEVARVPVSMIMVKQYEHLPPNHTVAFRIVLGCDQAGNYEFHLLPDGKEQKTLRVAVHVKGEEQSP
jgi:hypothetical protein